MRKILARHHISFKHAFAGLFWAVRTQPNFRVHIGISLITLIGAWYFQITKIELWVIIFTIILGLAAEMINTSIESMTDLITTEWRTQAKIAKDVSAGMMLLVAIGAIIIAFIIFIPYIIRLFI